MLGKLTGSSSEATPPHHFLYSVDPAWLTREGPQNTIELRVGHPSGSPGSTDMKLPAPLEWALDTDRAKHVRGAPVRFRYAHAHTSRDGREVFTRPYLGVILETPAPDADSAKIRPIGAMSYDADQPPEYLAAPEFFSTKDMRHLAIPRDDLRGWWPKLDDGVYDSWRSLALAAQLAHPSPVTRCDIVLNGELVPIADDVSSTATHTALDSLFSKGPPTDDEGTAAAARLGLVRSAVSLRLRHEEGDTEEEVEAPVLIPQGQIRRHRREYDAFSPV